MVKKSSKELRKRDVGGEEKEREDKGKRNARKMGNEE